MKQRVYIETTIVSYLTAKPSQILITAAHQEVTRQWCEQRHAFDLRVSQFVLDEASDGDQEMAAKRLAALRDVPVLADSLEARALAKDFIEQGVLPEAAGVDALHLAMATVHEIDVLLTWNCRHLANAAILGKLAKVARMNGYEMPIVCTPVELTTGEEAT